MWISTHHSLLRLFPLVIHTLIHIVIHSLFYFARLKKPDSIKT